MGPFFMAQSIQAAYAVPCGKDGEAGGRIKDERVIKKAPDKLAGSKRHNRVRAAAARTV